MTASLHVNRVTDTRISMEMPSCASCLRVFIPTLTLALCGRRVWRKVGREFLDGLRQRRLQLVVELFLLGNAFETPGVTGCR